MFDIATETLVPLREIPNLLPVRRNGKKLHISAVYRWTTSGVRGVRLDSVRIGGTCFSSLQALQRFSEKLSENPAARTAPGATPKRREQALHRISERVAQELGLSNRRQNSDRTATTTRS